MRCEDIFEDLLILLDGELDDPRRMLVEKHLEDCPVCAARLAKLQAIDECLRGSLSIFETAPDISDAVMSEIKAGPVKPVRRFIWAFAAGFIAAAACLVLLILSKPDNVKPAHEKPQMVEQTPNQKTAPVSFVPQKELKESEETKIASERKGVKTAPRRPAPKKIAQFQHQKHTQEKEEPAKVSPKFSLRVELRITGDSNSIVVSTGPIEQIIETEPRDKAATLPPNPEASSIKRPPLQTVVSTDPIALLMPKI